MTREELKHIPTCTNNAGEIDNCCSIVPHTPRPVLACNKTHTYTHTCGVNKRRNVFTTYLRLSRPVINISPQTICHQLRRSASVHVHVCTVWFPGDVICNYKKIISHTPWWFHYSIFWEHQTEDDSTLVSSSCQSALRQSQPPYTHPPTQLFKAKNCEEAIIFFN